MTAATFAPTHATLAGKDELRLLIAFFALYKTARMVDSNNAMFRRQSVAILDAMSAVGQGDDIVIKRVAGRFFVNDKLTRFDEHGPSAAYKIIAEWQELGIGGVRFSSEMTAENVEEFFTCVADVKPGEIDLESLCEKLKSCDIARAELLSALEGESEEEDYADVMRSEFRVAARRIFSKAMTICEDIIVKSAHGKDINISKARRVVQSLINHITKDESSLIELTAIKEYDDYTYAHSTNVCVYSLTLGARLGLDRARLCQLGFSALFHDIGKVKLPADLIKKPDKYDENDWVQIQRHPILGAKTILRSLKLDDYSAHAAQVAFEHHINADHTGYPHLRYKQRDTCLFSKIVTITDTFDALTSGRVYMRNRLEPDVALKKMSAQMSVKFDPILLKLFMDVVGVYPAGSLLLLSTNEIALVITHNDRDMARPYVKIVGNREGLLDMPEWVDLAQPEQEHRRVVRAINPEQYGLRPSDFILAD